MDIKTWFTRAVAAGLMPKNWKDIIAYPNIYDDGKTWHINSGRAFPWGMDAEVEMDDEDFYKEIQLRKDGKDLYRLEWRKPNIKNMGEYAWMYSAKNDVLQKVVINHDLLDFEATNSRSDWKYLLADHNQIAPTEQDFKRIYGE